MSEIVQVKAWGELACFTRPEFGVERMSYEVMTPSAARGLLESVFWKPEFRWVVREIRVLNEIRWTSFMRNEVEGNSRFANQDRAQRHTRALRDVAYVIKAQIQLKEHANANEAKYLDQFRRRVQKGQCFRQPVFGPRECTAFFEPPNGDVPIDLSIDLGVMLYDSDYEARRPLFFNANLEHGVMYVPPLTEVL